MSDSSRPPRPRALFVAALLLLTLVLAGVLALQARRTFLDHRATAERVLRDNARLAAARFAQRVGMELYYTTFWPIVDALSRAKAGTPDMPLPSPAKLAVGLDSTAAGFLKHAHYSFRYDLGSRRLETAGGAPSPAARTWLVDTLPGHVHAVYDPKERLAAIVRTVDGVRRAIVYTVAKHKTGGAGTVVGVDGDPAAFGAVYTMGEEKFPLLPRPLIARHPADDQFGRHVGAQRHVHGHTTHHRLDAVAGGKGRLVLDRRAVQLDPVGIGHDRRAE